MASLWRISNFADLKGIGGLRASARWHTAGRPIVYTAPNPSAALLEVLVHQYLTMADLPDTYQLLHIECPDDVARERIDPAKLPADWRDNEAVTRALGDKWLAEASTALLEVPSVITPDTFNTLLNPLHPDATRLVIAAVEQIQYDPRLR